MADDVKVKVLIEPQWNVNFSLPGLPGWTLSGTNRTIVECKFCRLAHAESEDRKY